ncbi:MAG TPA: hypothetical protein VHV83_21875 [Armatimonadota bacterium]|nr:hypothetical protein [Armatimonadota bacterium]
MSALASPNDGALSALAAQNAHQAPASSGPEVVQAKVISLHRFCAAG